MGKKELFERMEELREVCNGSCKTIWEHPETGGTERFSSDYFRELLQKEGFRIVNEEHLPYAFYAEYGSGSPVIAILGEYDALPGMSQKVQAEKGPVTAGAPGHACGHNLLGTAAAVGAIAVRHFLEDEGLAGTVRFYGCPEEELLSGKVKMAYYHMFDGCDLALSWHPMYSNMIYDSGYTALASARFTFTGTPAHAAAAPELGRSALDAMEIMNVGANYLREHVPDGSRIQYTTDSCGSVPNIVPEHAASWYFVRAAHMDAVKDILRRLELCAKGAAIMTETKAAMKIEYGCCEMMGVETLSDVTYENLKAAPMPVYTEEELAFAKAIQATASPAAVSAGQKLYEAEGKAIADHVVSRHQCDKVSLGASSDSGDVSMLMPMCFFTASAWPIGVAPHTWQACACTGSSLGQKAAFYAAQVFAGTAYDLFAAPELCGKIKDEFAAQGRSPYTPMYEP